MIHVSNALGTVEPVADIVRKAHAAGAVVLIDGAQAAAHVPVDVQALGADFYAFSGHKMFGPTGTGVLYGQAALLERMPPYQGGGDMIASVTFEKTTYNVAAVQVRGGNAEHRRRGRPRRRGGLPDGVDREAVACARRRSAGVRHRTGRDRARRAPHRRGAGRRRACCRS